MKKPSLKAFATTVTFSPVESDEEKNREIKQIIDKAKTGEETTFLLTPEEFSKVFTSERLRLLRLVRNKPESINYRDGKSFGA